MLWWMEKTSDEFFSTTDRVMDSISDRMSSVGYDQPYYENIVLVEERKHWNFTSERMPSINLEILQWLEENSIEQWSFRQQPNKGPGYMGFQMEFFDPAHATLFKLRWV